MMATLGLADTRKSALWISIATNVILITLLVAPTIVDHPAVSTDVKFAAQPEQTHSKLRQLTQPFVISKSPDEKTIIPPLVEETGLLAYADQLRKLGMAEKDVADIIYFRLTRIFERRYRSIQPEENGDRYWLTNQVKQPRETEDIVLQKQALRWELRNILADILGEKWRYALNLGAMSFYYFEFQFLPPNKRAALNDVRELYRARRGSGGEVTEEHRRQQREYEDQIASILSPMELEQYKMRRSSEARVASGLLAQMSPSEEEFKVVYELARQYGEDAFRLAPVGELADELSSLLGADRFRELVVAQDNQYGKLKKTANERGYSIEQTLSMAERKLEIMQGRDGFVDLSRSEKRKRLVAMRDKLTDAAKDVLGVDAVDDPAIAGYLELAVLQLQIDWHSEQ